MMHRLHADALARALLDGTVLVLPPPAIVETDASIPLTLGHYAWRPRSVTTIERALQRFEAGATLPARRLPVIAIDRTDPRAMYTLIDGRIHNDQLLIPNQTTVITHTMQWAGVTVSGMLPNLIIDPALASWGLRMQGWLPPGQQASYWTMTIHNPHPWIMSIPLGWRVARMVVSYRDSYQPPTQTPVPTQPPIDWTPDDLLPRTPTTEQQS